MTDFKIWNALQRERRTDRRQQVLPRLDDAISFSVGDYVWCWWRRRLAPARVVNAMPLEEHGQTWWRVRVYDERHKSWSCNARFVLIQRTCTPFEVHRFREQGSFPPAGEPLPLEGARQRAFSAASFQGKRWSR